MGLAHKSHYFLQCEARGTVHSWKGMVSAWSNGSANGRKAVGVIDESRSNKPLGGLKFYTWMQLKTILVQENN